MLSHVVIGSNDIERSKDFYNSVLKILDIEEPLIHINNTGQTRLIYQNKDSMFFVTEPINNEAANIANGSTIGFTCDSPKQVQKLHDAAIKSGGTSIESPPGLRESSRGKMYLCYFLDPDGHKICGIYRYDSKKGS